MVVRFLVLVSALLYNLALAQYVPTINDVNSFTAAFSRWPKTEPNMDTWKNLWDRTNPVGRFCSAGVCEDGGIDFIVSTWGWFAAGLAQDVRLTVQEWSSVGNVLWLTQEYQFMTTTGGCNGVVDMPRLVYYNAAGKITQLHLIIMPNNNMNMFVGAMLQNGAFNVGQNCSDNGGLVSPPSGPPPASTGYTPTQADADALNNALSMWPMTEPLATTFQALWNSSDPMAMYCINGVCTWGVERIVASWAPMQATLGFNTINSVTEIRAVEGTLWMRQARLVLRSPGGCLFDGPVQRLIYYNSGGQIVGYHLLIMPDAAYNQFVVGAFGGQVCSTTTTTTTLMTSRTLLRR